MEEGPQQIVKAAIVQGEYPRQIHVQMTSEISHPLNERRLAVRELDWMRLQRRINQLPAVPDTLTVWYSLFFGASLAALISLPPLFYTKDLPPWVVLAEAFLCIGSFVLGAGLRAVEKIFLRQRKAAADEVTADMADIIGSLQNGRQAPPT